MRYLMCFYGVLQVLFLGNVAHSSAAERFPERLALSLSGTTCSSQLQSIGGALEQVPGVNHVNLESVPDHALVDVVSPTVTSDTLIAAARRSIASGTQCQIETMKSCISADRMAMDR